MRRGPRGRRRRLRRGPHGARAVHRAGTHARRGRRGHARGLPDRLGAGGRGRPPDRHEAPRHRDAPGRPLGRGRRVRRPLAGRRGRRLRRRRARRRASRRPATSTPSTTSGARTSTSRSTPASRSGCRRSGRPLQFAGAERLGHGVRIVDDITAAAGRLGPARAAGGVRPRPAHPARDVPDLERPHRRRAVGRASTRSTCSAGCASGSRSTPTTG